MISSSDSCLNFPFFLYFIGASIGLVSASSESDGGSGWNAFIFLNLGKAYILAHGNSSVARFSGDVLSDKHCEKLFGVFESLGQILLIRIGKKPTPRSQIPYKIERTNRAFCVKIHVIRSSI